MEYHAFLKKDEGFTLLEMLLVLMIVGVISAFGIGIMTSFQSMGQATDTRKRMVVIEERCRDYYRGHRAMPTASVTPANAVPVEQSALDLEQKVRLDGWGRFFEFYAGGTITGLTVDNVQVAGVIISGGPNETIESITTPNTVFDTTGDDILIPVNVSKEATRIALNELAVLQDKANAFNDFYQGVDNDGNGITDDAGYGCQAVNTASYTGCPPSPATDTEDPNCGDPTMDIIDAGTSYTGICNGSDALSFVNAWYGLATEYLADPWGRPYIWGRDTLGLTAADGGTIGSGDARFHKFFSSGPNGLTGTDGGVTDDIIP